MNDLIIKIEKTTRKVELEQIYIGNDHENLQEKLIFQFDTFVDGQGRLEYEINGIKNYIILTKEDETYIIPVQNVITIYQANTMGKIKFQLVITEGTSVENVPVFKSNIFYLKCRPSINAVNEAPEGYELWIEQANVKLNEFSEAIEDINEALEDVNTAIEETNNLDLDANKVNKTTTVSLTKKNGTTKTVQIADGLSLEFMWQGTSLGIRVEGQGEYTFVDLQGIQGPVGPQGEAFQIKKTYSSIAEMNADFNNMQLGDYVMIASTVEVEDNAKLYTRGESQWIFISDFSGAQGIRGPVGATPNITIGTVVSGNTPSVTRSGTDENPVLNFVLVKGDKGDTGDTGATGATGNGISSIAKTSTSGLVDTYTITFTNGTTTIFEVTNGEDGEVTQTQLDVVIERQNRILNNTPQGTTTTNPAILNDSADLPLKDFSIEGKTLQNTTTGKNLLNTSLQDMKANNTNGTWNNNVYSMNGVTVTVNSDLSIAVNGTSTAQFTFLLCNNKSLEAGTYILNGINAPNEEARIYIWDNTWANITSALNSTEFTINDDKLIKVGINFYSGKTYNNFVIKPMISVNGGEYEPYTGGIPSPSLSYPQEIKNVEGIIQIVKSNSDNTQTKTYNFPLSQGQKLMYGSYLLKNGIYQVHKHVTAQAGQSSITINDMKPNGIFYSSVGGTLNNKTITFASELTESADIEYQLDEAETIPYTSEQKAIIDEIINDGTYKGTTHYTATANINPDMETIYYKDLETLINNIESRLSLLE